MRAGTERRLRRAVARRAGCEMGGRYSALCAYCGVGLEVDWRAAEPVFREVKVEIVGPGWEGLVFVPMGPAHLDHVIPESRNGPTSLDNTVIACAPCNMAKGDSALGDPEFVLWLQRRRNSGQRLAEVVG